MAGRGGNDGGGRDDAGATPRSPDTDLMASVGRNLASVYEDLLRQPMPPRIAELVARIGGEDLARHPGARIGEA